jgi:hypothetical protein
MLKIDAHVHIYPSYDLATTLEHAASNLCGAGDVTGGLCLTERPECRFFQQTASGELDLPTGWELTTWVDNFTHRFHRKTDTGTQEIFCFCGRQINTAERIEVAALFMDEIIPDGTPSREVIAAILERNGRPVLNWAFGKWLFGRGRLIRELVDEFGASIALCDSALRPHGWPEPAAFRQARQHGIALLQGTDPLPANGEEKVIGSFHSCFSGDFDRTMPSASLRNMINNSDAPPAAGGHRGSWLTVIQRQRSYYQSKGC